MSLYNCAQMLIGRSGKSVKKIHFDSILAVNFDCKLLEWRLAGTACFIDLFGENSCSFTGHLQFDGCNIRAQRFPANARCGERIFVVCGREETDKNDHFKQCYSGGIACSTLPSELYHVLQTLDVPLYDRDYLLRIKHVASGSSYLGKSIKSALSELKSGHSNHIRSALYIVKDPIRGWEHITSAVPFDSRQVSPNGVRTLENTPAQYEEFYDPSRPYQEIRLFHTLSIEPSEVGIDYQMLDEYLDWVGEGLGFYNSDTEAWITAIRKNASNMTYQRQKTLRGEMIKVSESLTARGG